MSDEIIAEANRVLAEFADKMRASPGDSVEKRKIEAFIRELGAVLSPRGRNPKPA